MRKYLVRAFWIVFYAAAFFVITYIVMWEILDGNSLIAYIFNGVFILLVTTEDKIRFYYLEKRKNKPTHKQKLLNTAYEYSLMSKYNLSSMKSSMYLFYIFALVTSHILMLSPQLDVSESIRSYFTTIGYSLIILIAVDKFVGQFVKDDKRIKTYEEKPPL